MGKIRLLHQLPVLFFARRGCPRSEKKSLSYKIVSFAKLKFCVNSPLCSRKTRKEMRLQHFNAERMDLLWNFVLKECVGQKDNMDVTYIICICANFTKYFTMSLTLVISFESHKHFCYEV